MTALERAVARRYRLLLWVVLGLGTAIRLVIAAKASNTGIMEGWAQAGQGLERWGLDVYGQLNTGDQLDQIWSWPPAYLPYLELAVQTGDAFKLVARIPPIVADAALALLVQAYLGACGSSRARRLAASGLIALSPVLIAVAAFDGHFDSVAILPAVCAVMLWERSGPPRALRTGVLVGVGAAVKTVPLLALLALLPSATSRREGTAVSLVAAGIPLLAVLPFLTSDTAAVADSFRYQGLPGYGGLSVLVQPELVNQPFAELSLVSDALQGVSIAATLAGVLAIAAYSRGRAPPVQTMALLWLCVFALTANWSVQYLSWGLPFLLMAGWIRLALVTQLLLVPQIVGYVVGAVDPGGWPAWSSIREPLIVGTSALLALVWSGKLALEINDLARDHEPLSTKA